MKYKDVSRRLKKLGCQEIKRRGRGSHRKWYNPITKKSTSVPFHGSRELKSGVVRQIAKHLEINWEDFINAGR